jgi:hypothetical protein
MSDAAGLDLSHAQLFLDDALIEDHARVARRFHAARKHAEPILRPDRPWEGATPVMFGTVLRHEGRFRMWYCTGHPASPVQVCYAESDDGLHWRKPALGLIPWQGSTENNICLSPVDAPYIDDISVIEDPQDARWPLKALFWEGAGSAQPNSGIRAARSRDGIRWDVLPGFVLDFGDRFNAMPHRDHGRFVLLGRTPATYQGRHGPCGQDRLVFRTESGDLLHWSGPVLVNKPDLQDPPPFRIYSQTAFRYEGRLLGFLERMWVVPDVVDPELTWSEDGFSWQRAAERAAFIPRGASGTWDGNWLNLSSNGPIPVGNRLWFYYSGRSGCHACPYPTIGAFGLATLRRDGFASIDAEEEPGYLTTKPFLWPGGDLLVNADPRRSADSHPRHIAGWLAADVRDADGNVLPGFDLESCRRIEANSERESATGYLPLGWRPDRSLDDLKGRTLRLRFHLKDVALYSFKSAPKAS